VEVALEVVLEVVLGSGIPLLLRPRLSLRAGLLSPVVYARVAVGSHRRQAEELRRWCTNRSRLGMLGVRRTVLVAVAMQRSMRLSPPRAGRRVGHG